MNSPLTYKSPLDRCVIRVGDNSYDATTWRHSHPGGCELIDKFNNMDATDAFYAFHSDEAWAKLKRMKSKPLKDTEMPRDDLSLRFDRDVRQPLMAAGWMKRNWIIDFFAIVLPTTLLGVFGTMLAFTHPITAIILLGIGMQQAGWMAHDYCHGRGTLSKIVGTVYGCVYGGFSPDWWNHKHNTHHCFPNRLGYDADIHNEPILHLWFPEDGKDHWIRQYQHYYYLPVFSFLYVSWRMQSVQYALASKNWAERIALLAGYVWLAYLPLAVSIGAVLLGGLLVAVIVTANHQTEEILEADAPYNYMNDQYKTTRGVHTADPFTFFLFGGMQFQLEHHMFPFMPRYYYKSVRPILEKFAKENDLQFHVSGVAEILKLNYGVMKQYANAVKDPKLVKKTN